MIGRHNLPARPGGFHLLDGPANEAPRIPPRRFEMRNMHRQLGLFTDPHRFIHRRQKIGALVADVARIDAFVLGDDFGDLDEFPGLGVGSGNIDQSRGHAPGPILHGFVGEFFHAAEFFFAVGARKAEPITSLRSEPWASKWAMFVPTPAALSFL